MNFSGKPVTFSGPFKRLFSNPAALSLGVITLAFCAFEIFNFSTTEYAFKDILGGTGSGATWSFVLAIAFCGIDLAGLARLFTPQFGNEEPAEVWYLFGAWILAAAMNATLTWWGVASSIEKSGTVFPEFAKDVANYVPVFIALLVWVIRILIISSFSMMGDRLFHLQSDRNTARRPQTTDRPQINQTKQKPADYRPWASAQNPAFSAKPQGSGKPISREEPSYFSSRRDDD